MKEKFKKYVLYASMASALYLLLGYHFVYCGGTTIKLLKKSEYNLHYTFYSIESKRPETIMQIDDLRYDGIGELLVEVGKITEGEKMALESKYDREYYYDYD